MRVGAVAAETSPRPPNKPLACQWLRRFHRLSDGSVRTAAQRKGQGGEAQAIIAVGGGSEFTVAKVLAKGLGPPLPPGHDALTPPHQLISIIMFYRFVCPLNDLITSIKVMHRHGLYEP